VSAERFRCGACGNRTRFDVFERKRTRSFFHFTLGGDLTIEEEEALEHEVERIVCRWCGSADQIERVSEESAT
jgi:hypothetical protein